jgi:hypothetical protein
VGLRVVEPLVVGATLGLRQYEIGAAEGLRQYEIGAAEGGTGVSKRDKLCDG